MWAKNINVAKIRHLQTVFNADAEVNLSIMTVKVYEQWNTPHFPFFFMIFPALANYWYNWNLFLIIISFLFYTSDWSVSIHRTHTMPHLRDKFKIDMKMRGTLTLKDMFENWTVQKSVSRTHTDLSHFFNPWCFNYNEGK